MRPGTARLRKLMCCSLVPCSSSRAAPRRLPARSWALERYGVQHVVEPHAPGFHVPAVKAAGKEASTSTPLLVVPAEGTTLPDSGAILRWVDAHAPAGAPRLFPRSAEAEVEALCSRFDARVGVAARALVYAHALDLPEIAEALAPPSVPASQRFAWRYLGLSYVVRAAMRAGMAISPENGARALELLRSEFAAVDALLADGRRYLAGDGAGFTAADLSFAALAAPALGIVYGEHPPWQELEQLPAPLRAAAEELRATSAGQHAIRMWAEERSRVLKADGAAADAGEQ